MRTIGYLDSSSVSMVASAIVAGFAGVVLVAKMGFRRFVALFSANRRAELRAEKQAAQAGQIPANGS